MNINDKINKWFNDNWGYYESEVRTNIAWGEMTEYAYDLCIECFESFMNKSQEQREQMYNDDKILNYLLYCCSFQIRSGTSPFYNKYRKNRVKHIPEYFAENEQGGYELDEVSIDTYYGCMKEAMTEENIGWYYCKLLELKFTRQMSYKEIINMYGISEITLRRDIELALESVRKYCKHI